MVIYYVMVNDIRVQVGGRKCPDSIIAVDLCSISLHVLFAAVVACALACEMYQGMGNI